MRNLFELVRFGKDEWTRIMKCCEQMEIDFLCTPQTVGDFEDLLELGIKEVKISSDNLGNYALLDRVKQSGLPVIVSTGMGTGGDLDAAWSIITPNDYTVLVCTSEYPCPPESVNLSRIHDCDGNEADIWDHKGFSDHTQGNTAAVMAVALGATVIEKHFTLDHDLAGPDHWWSLNPEELKSYIAEIRLAERMLGDGEFKPTEKELENRKLMGI